MIQKRRAERIARADCADDFYRNCRRVNPAGIRIEIAAVRTERQEHKQESEVTPERLRVVRKTEHRSQDGKLILVQFHDVCRIQRLLKNLSGIEILTQIDVVEKQTVE